VTPEVVAEIIVRAVESHRPRARYYVTFPAKLFGFAHRFMPDRMWDYLTKKAYGFDKIEREYREAERT
jgi:hypothetical protein